MVTIPFFQWMFILGLKALVIVPGMSHPPLWCLLGGEVKPAWQKHSAQQLSITATSLPTGLLNVHRFFNLLWIDTQSWKASSPLKNLIRDYCIDGHCNYPIPNSLLCPPCTSTFQTSLPFNEKAPLLPIILSSMECSRQCSCLKQMQ